MQVAIGADHGGFELKEFIKDYLKNKGIDVKDYGTNSGESVNYPDFGHAVAKHVQKEKTKGIVICGSGIGISISANRHKGIRAAVIKSAQEAKLAREHNDLNILALAGRFTSKEDAIKIIEEFLNTEFEGGRHTKRIEAIEVK